MGFWANVEEEMKYQGISRKELAYRAKISYAGIGLGLERDSMPGADTAVRISKALGVRVETLLYGPCAQDSSVQPREHSSGCYEAAAELEKLPAEIRSPILEMIHKLCAGTGRIE